MVSFAPFRRIGIAVFLVILSLYIVDVAVVVVIVIVVVVNVVIVVVIVFVIVVFHVSNPHCRCANVLYVQMALAFPHPS